MSGQIRVEVRDAALEEAAKIADQYKNDGDDVGEAIAELIRALKKSPAIQSIPTISALDGDRLTAIRNAWLEEVALMVDGGCKRLTADVRGLKWMTP